MISEECHGRLYLIASGQSHRSPEINHRRAVLSVTFLFRGSSIAEHLFSLLLRLVIAEHFVSNQHNARSLPQQQVLFDCRVMPKYRLDTSRMDGAAAAYALFCEFGHSSLRQRTSE